MMRLIVFKSLSYMGCIFYLPTEVRTTSLTKKAVIAKLPLFLRKSACHASSFACSSVPTNKISSSTKILPQLSQAIIFLR